MTPITTAACRRNNKNNDESLLLPVGMAVLCQAPDSTVALGDLHLGGSPEAFIAATGIDRDNMECTTPQRIEPPIEGVEICRADTALGKTAIVVAPHATQARCVIAYSVEAPVRLPGRQPAPARERDQEG
jgi:hypothetical protein